MSRLSPPSPGRSLSILEAAFLARRLGIPLCTGLILVAACGRSGGKNPVAPPAAPSNIGPILFRSLRDGNAEIYVLNPDSTNPARLTVISIETGFVSTISGPSAQVGGEEHLAVARIRGGALYWEPGADGPGWTTGGSVGFGLSRNMLLSFNLDHMVPDDPENSPQRSMNPLTVQLEFGTPFQRLITPTMQVGTGVYVQRQTELVFSGSGTSHFVTGPRKSHLGLNVGSGVAISLARRIALDLLVRYHQAGLAVEPHFRMTTVSAGLTYALPRTRH